MRSTIAALLIGALCIPLPTLAGEVAIRNGPRKLDSALSEIFLRFQATNLTLA